DNQQRRRGENHRRRQRRGLAQPEIQRGIETNDARSGQQRDAFPFAGQFAARIPGRLAEQRQQNHQRGQPAQRVEGERRQGLMDGSADGEVTRPQQRRNDQSQINSSAI